MKILVINCGSSSLKYKLFQTPGFKVITKGIIENIGEPRSTVKNHHQAIRAAFAKMRCLGLERGDIGAVGHRVVHGWEKFKFPVVINPSVISQIKKNSSLAPLHNPANLEGILACKKLLAKVKQVAVFDTAFYHTIPPHAYLYGLKLTFYKKHRIRRYGFHGTSHEYVAQKAASLLKKPLGELRLITLHLGNGCSISAIDRGKCIETSMGFTPLEGLMMGTRCGDIDAAVVFYMAQRLGLSLAKIDDILNKESGLLGVSGVSNDIRMIKKAIKNKNSRARLSLDMFVYRIKKYLYSYIGILKKVDAIVFTAGIGENNPDLRKAITRDLASFLKSRPRILTITTDEELMIASLTYQKLLQGKR